MTLRMSASRLKAETKVKVTQEKQRAAVDQQQETRNADSEVAGIQAQIEAEKQSIEMVRARCEAELIIPADATKQKMVQEAEARAAEIRGQAQAELTQLKRTIEILESAGEHGLTAYLIEKFGDMIEPFAQTLDLFPVDEITVISGKPQHNGPISAIHPNALDMEMNRRLEEALAAAAVTEKSTS